MTSSPITPFRTRFGTPLTLLSNMDEEGYLKATFHFEHGPSDREIHLADVRADEGLFQIKEALAKLPRFPKKP